MRSWTFWSSFVALAVLPGATSAQSGTSADPRLLEAIDLYTGTAGTVDDDRARELLLAASADGSDPLSTMWIARVHSTGRMGFVADRARAREVASGVIDRVAALAAAGDVEALFLMGTATDEGLGREVDRLEAYRWYRRAADRGHVLAAHNIGNMYREGRGLAQSDTDAVIWWLRAARAGDAIPALRLGEAFEAGRGVPMNPVTAAYWYAKAAELGNSAARAHLERLFR